ncbi:replication initiator [Spirillospora sp. CA-255316]
MLTVSFAKVAEYQRRGLVHFHAVIRLDRPGGPKATPPAWATYDVLAAVVTHARHAGRGRSRGSRARPRSTPGRPTRRRSVASRG